MKHPGLRSLTLLAASASTARVLNLRQVALDGGQGRDPARRPFFRNAALNRGLVLKHHLRRHEADLFEGPRTSATKVLLPIDHHNLRLGAKAFFIGQRDYVALMQAELGLSGADCRDLQMLAILDEIPSFDPFMLREQLRRRNLEVDPRYFNVSAADTERMMSFVQAQIQPLVDVVPGGMGEGASEALARKLLSDADDDALQPLRHVLRLDAEPFAEGVFCWRAFLYYKWRLLDLLPAISTVAAELATLKPAQRAAPETQDYLASARVNIHAAVTAACRSVSQTLQLYDSAYDGLVRRGDGMGFRDFLLQAPGRFIQLGTDLAAVDHIISFWTYRFPQAQRREVSAEELAAILRDFESSLNIASRVPAERDAA